MYKRQVRDAAQLELAVLQAFFELGPVQLHRGAHALGLFVLLSLAVLDILHVDIEEHVWHTVVNVRVIRTRTSVGAALHVDGQSAGYTFLLLALLLFIFFYFSIRSKKQNQNHTCKLTHTVSTSMQQRISCIESRGTTC